MEIIQDLINMIDGPLLGRLVAICITLLVGLVAVLALKRVHLFFDQKTQMSAAAARAFTRALRLVVFLVVLAILLSQIGVELGNLWTAVTAFLGLVAIGFVAVWSILSNLSSALVMLFDRPFRKGDYVEVTVDNLRGKVTGLGPFFVRLQDRAGNEVLYPNNQFYQKAFRVSETEIPEPAPEQG
ncbi:MAG: mechanosensitive ion channel domain-containing protein [Opitutales bacterium]